MSRSVLLYIVCPVVITALLCIAAASRAGEFKMNSFTMNSFSIETFGSKSAEKPLECWRSDSSRGDKKTQVQSCDSWLGIACYTREFHPVQKGKPSSAKFIPVDYCKSTVPQKYSFSSK